MLVLNYLLESHSFREAARRGLLGADKVHGDSTGAPDKVENSSGNAVTQISGKIPIAKVSSNQKEGTTEAMGMDRDTDNRCTPKIRKNLQKIRKN